MVEEREERIPLPKLFEAVLPYQAGVYVTVLNIIQCIALAFLINAAREAFNKHEINFIWCLRGLLALIIILFVWHRYVSEFQYLWPMSWFDTLIPFSIGINECVIVFFCDPEVAELPVFASSVLVLQLSSTFAYWYSYLKRKDKFTEKLYRDFYVNHPQFVSRLIVFIKRYDWGNVKRIIIFFIISLGYLLVIIQWPGVIHEVLFSLGGIIVLIHREIFYSFNASLRKDPSMSPYFQ